MPNILLTGWRGWSVRMQAEAVKDAKMKKMIRDNKRERDYFKPGKYKLTRTQETSGRFKKEMISGKYRSKYFYLPCLQNI